MACHVITIEHADEESHLALWSTVQTCAGRPAPCEQVCSGNAFHLNMAGLRDNL